MLENYACKSLKLIFRVPRAHYGLKDWMFSSRISFVKTPNFSLSISGADSCKGAWINPYEIVTLLQTFSTPFNGMEVMTWDLNLLEYYKHTEPQFSGVTRLDQTYLPSRFNPNVWIQIMNTVSPILRRQIKYCLNFAMGIQSATKKKFSACSWGKLRLRSTCPDFVSSVCRFSLTVTDQRQSSSDKLEIS